MRTGSLCSGYEGLGMAVQAVLGGELAWVADNDPGAAAILAHRFPSVPNLGDISAAEWGAVEPVQILTAGFPCQDVSCAGARKGLRAGNRTGVWAYVAEAIRALRPSLVLLENVRGLLTFGADSNLEPCPWCMGDSGDESVLRACGAVLADLADLGFDAEWALVSAAAVGAPHRRERVFILAWPAAADAASPNAWWWSGSRSAQPGSQPGEPWRPLPEPDDSGLAPADSDGASGRQRWITAPGQTEARRPHSDARGRDRAPAADTRGEGLEVRAVEHHGPQRPSTQRGSGDDLAPDAYRGRLESVRLAEPARLECSPWSEPDGRGDDRELDYAAAAEWGPYELAIRRWEHATGRSAPRPTEPGRTGERLAPRFVEWMMGLPEGWVTDVPGLSRNAQLKALGNGVVPQQAAMALRLLLERAGILPLVAADSAPAEDGDAA